MGFFLGPVRGSMERRVRSVSFFIRQGRMYLISWSFLMSQWLSCGGEWVVVVSFWVAEREAVGLISKFEFC